MNRYLFPVSIGVVLLWFSASQSAAQRTPSAEYVLQKVASKLAGVKLLGYKYNFEYNYPARDSRTVVNAQTYFDLQPADQKDGFKFQFIGEDRWSVYNGSERFTGDKKSKKLYVDSSPSFNSYGDIFLLNSPLALKNALPTILKDARIQKKVCDYFYALRYVRRDRFTIDHDEQRKPMVQ